MLVLTTCCSALFDFETDFDYLLKKNETRIYSTNNTGTKAKADGSPLSDITLLDEDNTDRIVHLCFMGATLVLITSNGFFITLYFIEKKKNSARLTDAVVTTNPPLVTTNPPLVVVVPATESSEENY